MKKYIILLSLLALTGCGYLKRTFAIWTEYSIICVAETNTQYVQFSSGAAPLLGLDGKPVKCN